MKNIAILSIVLMLIAAGALQGATATVTYQVSAGADDGFAQSAAVQDIGSSYLKIGDERTYAVPYQMSAMRFGNVNIPRSAIITSAYLKISSINTDYRNQIYGVIVAEASDNPADFSSRLIGNAALTAATVAWDFKNTWSPDTQYISSDISNVIQEVVNRSGFGSGNSIAIYYSTRDLSGKARSFASYEYSPASAAVLEITYETYTISGHILTTGAAPLEGVSVSAGTDIEGDVTDATGYYELKVPLGWSGTVSVSKTGWGFTEFSHSYTNVFSDQLSQDYTAIQPVISGYVKDGTGTGVEGVSVSADNSGGLDTTDANGYYEVIVPYNWTGTTSASLAGYNFTSKTYSTPVIADQTNQDFTGFQPTISGHVKDETGTGVEGVSVLSDNGGGSDTTDASGYYEITVPYDWSGTVTPEITGLGFEPVERTYETLTTDEINQDYTSHALYGGGSGIEASPYLIYTAEQMQAIGSNPVDWDKHFKLMANIDLSDYTGMEFNIIGNAAMPFTGSFDGDGHMIANFTYSGDEEDNIGIFGYVNNTNTEIKNLGLIDPNVGFRGNSEWSQTFGGREIEASRSIQIASDGGYIIVGNTDSFGPGSVAVYLIKTDVAGNELWSRTLGGVGNDRGYSVQVTGDGGYIITGTTGSFGAGWFDVYLIKTDSAGNEQWSRTFGGSHHDYGYSVQMTSDGGYIIAGYTKSFGAGEEDVYLIKTNAAGNQEWSRTLGGISNDRGYSVQVTSDGGYIIAGHTSSFGAGGWDAYLIKTDAAGNEQWSRTFGGSEGDKAYSVQVTDDGGYVITGETKSFGNVNGDVYLIKTDAAGNEQWSRTFGGISSDQGNSLQTTSDGGYIIAGQTWSFGAGGWDAYLIKTDAAGNEQWSRTFGGSDWDKAYSVQATDDGGYVITGNTSSFGAGESDVYLLKTDKNGQIIFNNQGALIGYLAEGKVSSCMIGEGSVTASGYVGALVGKSAGIIEDCYSTTAVSYTGSDGSTGGLVGKNEGEINRCFSAGVVNSVNPGLSGGLVGSSLAGTVTGSFWDTETSGQSNSAGGIGLTTAEMQMEVTYTMPGAAGGWDLSNIWAICDGYGYPYLRWEGFPPCIEIPNNTLAFTAISKTVNPDDQLFTIVNSCEGILNWSIDKPAECDWLNVLPLSNNSNPDVNEVTVSIDVSGLDYGSHSCQLAVSDPDAQNSPQYVTVDLEVLRPELFVSPGQFYFETALDEPNNAGQVLSIQNAGYDILHWGINVPDEYNWLKFSESSGQTDANETSEIILGLDHNEVEAGFYEFDITVSDPNADNSPQIIPIEVQVLSHKGQRHVPAEYDTIQAAIDAAVDGDEVIVHPGIYKGEGNCYIGVYYKSITIRSIDPNDPETVAKTIIDGSLWYSDNQVVGIYTYNNPNELDGTIVIDGLTIKNCNGAGIVCNYGRPIIRNCIITDNLGSPWNYGGAILCFENAPVISNCIIRRNFGGEVGTGGIAIYNGKSSGDSSISNCLISNNYNYYSRRGGVDCRGVNLTISNCTISNNITLDYYAGEQINDDIGRGVFIENSNVVIKNSIIWDSVADDGTQIAILDFSESWSPPIPAKASILYSDIKGGEEQVFIAPDRDSYLTYLRGTPIDPNLIDPNTLNWGTGNLDTDPCFAKPGFWHLNNTPADANDDFPVDGDYHLKSQTGRWEWSQYISLDPTGDGFIDLSDFTAFASYWNNSRSPIYIPQMERVFYPYVPADFDDSGIVDLSDLKLLLDSYVANYPFGEWVTDDITSPCIDAGDPNSDWTAELWQHGKRINMGAYGGTPQASMSLSAVGNKADLNNDGFVNTEDLALFVDKWPAEEVLLSEDINRNGLVNFSDWAEFAMQWLWEE